MALSCVGSRGRNSYVFVHSDVLTRPGSMELLDWLLRGRELATWTYVINSFGDGETMTDLLVRCGQEMRYGTTGWDFEPTTRVWHGFSFGDVVVVGRRGLRE